MRIGASPQYQCPCSSHAFLNKHMKSWEKKTCTVCDTNSWAMCQKTHVSFHMSDGYGYGFRLQFGSTTSFVGPGCFLLMFFYGRR